MSTEQKAKDKLRSLTVGAKKQFKTKLISIDGSDFEVRQPTVAERADLHSKAKGDDGEFSLLNFQVHAVIQTTFTPNSNDPVFTVEDFEGLSSQPTGGWFDKLSEAATEVCNASDEEAKKD